MPAPTIKRRGRRHTLGTVLAVTILLVITACRDGTVSDTMRPEEAVLARRRVPSQELTLENSAWLRRFEADTGSDCYTRRFRDADTLGSSDGLNLPSCPSQMVVTPNAGDGTYSLWHSPDAMDGNGSADSLVVTFSRPVGMLTILREGTHSCYDATIGQVVAYGADGAELGRSPFNLIQTCSDALPTLREDPTAVPAHGVPASATAAPYTSPYAPFAEAELLIPAGVTRLVFLPPAVWDFTFVNPYFPDDIRQYKRQGTYSLIFRTDASAPPTLLVSCAPAAPVRMEMVSCTAWMSDSTAFMPTHRKSETDGIVLVDESIAEGSEVRTYDWRGRAIVATDVEISGRAGQALVSGKSSFSIRARSTFRDTTQSPTPDTLRGYGRPVMMTDYPGMVRTDTSWVILKGGIGRTWHIFPDVSVARAATGPNRGTVFARTFHWQFTAPDLGAAAIPAGIYIGAALFPGDPFYARQHGGRGYCSATGMDSLRADVYRHELHHYSQVIQLRQNMRLHEVYESRVVVPTASMTVDSAASIFTAPSTRYGMAMDSIDNSIDRTPATIFAPAITCNMRFP